MRTQHIEIATFSDELKENDKHPKIVLLRHSPVDPFRTRTNTTNFYWTIHYLLIFKTKYVYNTSDSVCQTFPRTYLNILKKFWKPEALIFALGALDRSASHPPLILSHPKEPTIVYEMYPAHREPFTVEEILKMREDHHARLQRE